MIGTTNPHTQKSATVAVADWMKLKIRKNFYGIPSQINWFLLFRNSFFHFSHFATFLAFILWGMSLHKHVFNILRQTESKFLERTNKSFDRMTNDICWILSVNVFSISRSTLKTINHVHRLFFFCWIGLNPLFIIFINTFVSISTDNHTSQRHIYLSNVLKCHYENGNNEQKPSLVYFSVPQSIDWNRQIQQFRVIARFDHFGHFFSSLSINRFQWNPYLIQNFQHFNHFSMSQQPLFANLLLNCVSQKMKKKLSIPCRITTSKTRNGNRRKLVQSLDNICLYSFPLRIMVHQFVSDSRDHEKKILKKWKKGLGSL